MFAQLDRLVERFDGLTQRMSDPDVARDPKAYGRLAKERAQLEEVVILYRRYQGVNREIEEVRSLAEESRLDPEMSELAESELEQLLSARQRFEEEIRFLLLPKDPHEEKNVILELRAGTGGEEAALFAADLFRMYARYTESRGWTIEVLSEHPTGVGGYKEVIALIRGERAYGRLKFEGGTHRVQRVPETESAGRIHTSAVTVAVLPEAEEVDVQIEPEDLRVDVFRSSGPGGQSVNTTDSAVRITHLPTGMVVTCQDEKSQHKNKAKALKVLRSRLLERKREEQFAEISQSRRLQVGSGDRSERVRTYNFPQNRITDHRINLTLYRLDRVMEGDLAELIDALITADRTAALSQAGEPAVGTALPKMG